MSEIPLEHVQRVCRELDRQEKRETFSDHRIDQFDGWLSVRCREWKSRVFLGKDAIITDGIESALTDDASSAGDNVCCQTVYWLATVTRNRYADFHNVPWSRLVPREVRVNGQVLSPQSQLRQVLPQLIRQSKHDDGHIEVVVDVRLIGHSVERFRGETMWEKLAYASSASNGGLVPVTIRFDSHRCSDGFRADSINRVWAIGDWDAWQVPLELQQVRTERSHVKDADTDSDDTDGDTDGDSESDSRIFAATVHIPAGMTCHFAFLVHLYSFYNNYSESESVNDPRGISVVVTDTEDYSLFRNKDSMQYHSLKASKSDLRTRAIFGNSYSARSVETLNAISDKGTHDTSLLSTRSSLLVSQKPHRSSESTAEISQFKQQVRRKWDFVAVELPSDKVLDRMFAQDWKEIQLADLVQGAANRAPIKDLLRQHYNQLVQVFQYFCVITLSDDTNSYMGMLAFGQFSKECFELLDERLTMQRVDEVFKRVNVEEEFEEIVNPDGTVTAKMITQPQGDESNPDHLFTRSEFIESVVRLAAIKFPDSSEPLVDRTERLLTEHVLSEHSATIKTLRQAAQLKQRVSAQDAQLLFSKVARKIRKVFDHFAAIGERKESKRHSLSQQQWHDMCEAASLFNPRMKPEARNGITLRSLSRRELALCFGMSQDLSDMNPQHAATLEWNEFVEALARVTETATRCDNSGEDTFCRRFQRVLRHVARASLS
ncbi:MAG: hypothetical protein MHM6MM_000585 [Cercozoa sp. M6MM]